MIKFTRQGNGLRDYINQISYIDTNETSKDYFRVLDFPSRLFVGKNIIRLSGNNDTLVLGSKIYVDVVDINGKIVYHEVLNIVNKDKSRTLVVYVYSDTPAGEATIYIAGRLSHDPVTGKSIPFSNSPVDPNYKNIPNIIWYNKTTIVTNKQNTSEVFFVAEPKVNFSEKFVKFNSISGSNFRTTISSGSTGNETLSMKSRIQPIQYSNESVFQTEFIDSNRRVRPIPDVVNNKGNLKGLNKSQNIVNYLLSGVMKHTSINQ